MYRILLVDDEANERSGVRFLIERYGFPLSVTEAANGKQALETIEKHPIDILLTDVKMPYMDGLELAQHVNEAYPHIRIIIFSAYGEFEYAKKAMEANAVNYLLKPIDVNEFHRVVSGVIAGLDEQHALLSKQQNQLLTDRKLFLSGLLAGRVPTDATAADRLKAFSMDIVNKHMALLQIETQGSYFAQHEAPFLTLLTTYAPCETEYVNSYPNAASLLLYQRARLDCDTLRTFAEKLAGDMMRLHGETVSILIGDDVKALSDLPFEAGRMASLRTRMFGWEAPVIFASDLAEPEQNSCEDIERQREVVEQAIEARDAAMIERETQRLLDVMMAHKTLSNAYIHHVFCDLIGKLYTGYGFYDSLAVQRQIAKLTLCRGRRAVLALFSEILAEISTRQREDVADVGYAVARVTRMIKNEYAYDLSLDYLAERVGLAPAYLSFVFKRETGENLIKFITDYRMEKAKELLDGGQQKVVQVARMCGYENPSYFNRLFKNAFGVTPKQYREKGDA